MNKFEIYQLLLLLNDKDKKIHALNKKYRHLKKKLIKYKNPEENFIQKIAS